MQHHGVELVAEGDAVEPVGADGAQDSAHFGLIVLDIGGLGSAPRRRRRRRRHGICQRIENLDQGAGARGLDADGLDHRHAELGRQARRIDDDAFAARDVRHVERDHHRQAQALRGSSTSRRFWRRLVASVTQTTKSGGLSPAAPPEQHIGGDLLHRASTGRGYRHPADRECARAARMGVSSEPSLRSTVTPA